MLVVSVGFLVDQLFKRLANENAILDRTAIYDIQNVNVPVISNIALTEW